MLPFGLTIPATVPQKSEIPEGVMNYPVYRPNIASDKMAGNKFGKPHLNSMKVLKYVFLKQGGVYLVRDINK